MFFFSFFFLKHRGQREEKTRKIFHLPRNFQISERVGRGEWDHISRSQTGFSTSFSHCIHSIDGRDSDNNCDERGREAAESREQRASLATCFRIWLAGEGKLRFVRHDSISTETPIMYSNFEIVLERSRKPATYRRNQSISIRFPWKNRIRRWPAKFWKEIENGDSIRKMKIREKVIERLKIRPSSFFFFYLRKNGIQYLCYFYSYFYRKQVEI